MNLRQLAEHLKLSQTTVSRALNGYSDVGEDTRRRVREAAHRFSYRPNPHAMSLATGKSHAVGHVLPADRSLMLDPLFIEFVAGAGEVYGSMGFDIVLSVAGPVDEATIYRRHAAAGSVDGIVVNGPRRDDWRIDLLSELGLPFIVHGRVDGREAGYAWLDIDNRGAFRQATKLLTDLGHRRIALINGIETMTFAAHRRCGYEEALAAAGIAADPNLMSSEAMTEETGYLRMRHLMSLSERPTAVLCSSMLLTSGVIRAVHERGLRIGEDVSIVAHDDGLPFLAAEGLSPPLTVTRSPIRAAGTRIAELMLAMLKSPEAPLPQELWTVDLVVRGSTGRA